MMAAGVLVGGLPSLLGVGALFLVLAAFWSLLRFTWKLTTRVLTTGCAAIVLIGLTFLLGLSLVR